MRSDIIINNLYQIAGVSWPDMHRLAEKTIVEEFIKEGLLVNGKTRGQGVQRYD